MDRAAFLEIFRFFRMWTKSINSVIFFIGLFFVLECLEEKGLWETQGIV